MSELDGIKLEELHRRRKHVAQACEELRKAGYGSRDNPRDWVQDKLEEIEKKIREEK